MKGKRIIVCGFMGSGKSTLISKISDDPNLFLDLDVEVLKLNAPTEENLAKYIDKIGFDEFRKVEIQSLKKILSSSFKVLSLGGGSLNNSSLNLIKSYRDTVLVHLNVNFEDCWERIKHDKSRPLVLKGKEYCHDLFVRRGNLYGSSDIIMDNESVRGIKSYNDLIRLLDEHPIS